MVPSDKNSEREQLTRAENSSCVVGPHKYKQPRKIASAWNFQRYLGEKDRKCHLDVSPPFALSQDKPAGFYYAGFVR